MERGRLSCSLATLKLQGNNECEAFKNLAWLVDWVLLESRLSGLSGYKTRTLLAFRECWNGGAGATFALHPVQFAGLWR